MNSKNLLINFAPIFKEFGTDLVKTILKLNPEIKIIAICSGGDEIVNHVKKNINKKKIEKIIDLDFEEKKWLNLNQEIDFEYLNSYEHKFDNNYLGKLITADRRLGFGYVSGARVRPNFIADLSTKYPDKLSFIYIQNAIKFFESLFNSHSISLVYSYTVSSTIQLLVAYFSGFHSIKFRILSATRILDRLHYDKCYLGKQIEIEKHFNNKNYPLKIESKNAAIGFLNNYRKKQEPPEYTNFYLKPKIEFFLGFLKNITFISVFYIKWILPKNIRQKFTKLKFRHKLFYLKLDIIKLVYNPKFETEIPSNKFAYFPLHVDPESSTMVLEPYFTDQLTVIKNISKALPSNMILVVKEHIPMIGFRPRNFYKEISSYPRVKLLDPSLDQFELIKKSTFVAIITGSTGLEALLLKKKLLMLSSNTNYSFLKKGMIVQTDFSKINNSINELIEMDCIDDQTLIRYISIILENSLPISSKFYLDYKGLNPIIKKNTLNTLSKKVIEDLN